MPAKKSPRALPHRVPAPRVPPPRSIYAPATRPGLSVDDMIPHLLSVVAPHVEALEAVDHPLASLFGERLRRALVRLEPLLDEALNELQALKNADVEVASCVANLRDAMRASQTYLLAAGAMKSPPRIRRPADRVGMGELHYAELWEARLRRLGGEDALVLSGALSDTVRSLMHARHEEVRAQMVLDDTHVVLRLALLELASVGLSCEEAFPEVARRVSPREMPVPDEVKARFDVQ
jgi:hypothetical protein